MKITGTFIDEISHDIPSANWGQGEWAREFDAMKDVGIDTVILIRAGYGDKVTFDSDVIRKHSGSMMPVPYDMVDLFLSEAERCGMGMFLGIYDSGRYWNQGDAAKEVELNMAFAEELVLKYGSRKAFSGWYVSHEIDVYDPGYLDLYQKLTSHLKQLKDTDVMISPFVHGKKQFSDSPITLEDHAANWEKLLDALQGNVDIVAFQDGHIDYRELPDYLALNRDLSRKYGMESWSNIETFSRDLPLKFFPIGWPELLWKINAASDAGLDKLITFEFSHFMSPNSMYSSAHGLHDRYVEWLSVDE